MRHGVSGRKLNRSTSHRLAMFRNMVTSLLNVERIYTTVAKAKEMRRWAEWMITLGKHGDLHSRRRALRNIREKKRRAQGVRGTGPEVPEPSPADTRRIVKVGFRRGDAAPMCLLELIGEEKAHEKAKKKAAQKAAKKAKTEAVSKAKAEEEKAEG